MEESTSKPEQELKGQALTEEQLSDVYTAGTSDGVHQLSNGKVNLDKESYEK
ncbi:hypothetical protein D3C78_1379990 [compost metagenome]